MHGFIGGGAFPRNHTPRNLACSTTTLRLPNSPPAGLSEPPNPKWLDRRDLPGAINFLSPPPYAKDGGTPVFSWSAASTWQGPVAAGVNPQVTGKIGEDKSRAALVRSAEKASTLSASKRSWGDLRSHGKMYNKPSPPDIWTKRDRAHNKIYRDRENWGPSRSHVSARDLAVRYGLTRFEECRERPDFPKPASAWTWHRHEILDWERRACRHPDVGAIKIKGAGRPYIGPNHEHGGNSLVGLLGYTHHNLISRAATLRNKGVVDPAKARLERGEWDHFARLAKGGDERAFDILAAAAISVAKSVAGRLRGHSRMDADDLASEALIWFSGETLLGSLQSVLDKWDTEGGRGFLVFLRKSIEWRVKNVTRRNVPTELSLDTPVGDNGAVVADFIADDADSDGFDHDDNRARLDKLMFENLTDREGWVIERRHCLDGAEVAPTLEQLGAEVGRSRETIRKIEIAAEQKIGLKR